MKALETTVRVVAVGITLAVVMCVIFPQGGKKDGVPLRKFVEQECERQGVPFEFIDALITVESGWNPDATNAGNRNGTADHGLGQLNDATLKAHGLTKQDAYNPRINAVVTIKRAKEALLSVATKARDKREMYYLAAANYNAGNNLRAGYPHAEKVVAVLMRKLFEKI